MDPSTVAVARRLLPAAACSLLLACYKSAVHVPPELAPAPRLEVTGSRGWHAGERLAFGEYDTVRRHRAGAAARFLADLVRATVEEPVEFVLRARDHDLWTVSCARVERLEEPGPDDVQPLAFPVDRWGLGQRLSCTLRHAGGDSASSWRLTVQPVPNEVPDGELIGPTGRLQVVGSVHNHEGQVLRGARPLGYYIRGGGRAIAALEVIGGGAVWLDPELSPGQRDIIAAALAALLIWDGLIS